MSICEHTCLCIVTTHLPPLLNVENVKISMEPIIYFHPFAPLSLTQCSQSLYFLCVNVNLLCKHLHVRWMIRNFTHFRFFHFILCVCIYICLLSFSSLFPFTNMLEHNLNIIFSFSLRLLLLLLLLDTPRILLFRRLVDRYISSHFLLN